jgi:hypothetical protein
MKKAVLLLFSAYLCLASPPPRPQISNVFTAEGTIMVNVGVTFNGTAIFALNQPKGKGIESWNVPSFPDLNSFFLQRYDLNMSYEMDGPNPVSCEGNPLSGTMLPLWQFLSTASYVGQSSSYGLHANVWQSNRGYAKITVGVSVTDHTIPLWSSRKSSNREHTIIFQKFSPTEPDDSLFNIPKQCANPSLPKPQLSNKVGCVSRSTILSRGQTWVDAHVPYNQGATYGGYREDCSGFVSMTWELSKPGLTTRTLGSVSHRISKDDLAPGDVLLDAAEHVVLFAGWADGSKSHYISMEETRPGEGTVKRTTPYPYWYNTAAFIPYRYNNVC